MDLDGNAVLVFNLGSSSLKFSVYLMGPSRTQETLLVSGEAVGIGLEGSRLRLRVEDAGQKQEKKQKEQGKETQKPEVDTEARLASHEDAVRAILDAVDSLGGDNDKKNKKEKEKKKIKRPFAAGHRVVHGGPEHAAPALVDQKLIEELKNKVHFAPLHLPYEIRCMEAVARHYPHIPQVACFDTAFHRDMPEVARRLPLPGSFRKEGILRYGFHGLSYEYVIGAIGDEARGRVIVAHLGNGASMAAVRNGRPVDTTMGFTPSGGFMMGTRTGDLDPGVLLYLMAQKGFDADALDALVNHQAGLLGVSGVSPDMRTLLEKRDRLPGAALAVDMFCYQLKKNIGALAAALEGVDTLVFTGGIGEKAPPVRWQACQGLGHLGICLDAARNAGNEAVISAPDSRCTVRVIKTNEDLVIARHTAEVAAPFYPC